MVQIRYCAKKQFLASYNNWQPTEITQSPYDTPEYWYVEGQERLFASVTTFPRAIYVDIYNRLWIGTQDNGFTIYSPEQDTYKTYNQDNAPLLSDTITSFEYDPDSGLMFIGTENGLNSVEIGFEDNYNTQQELLKNDCLSQSLSSGFRISFENYQRQRSYDAAR